MKTIIQSIKGTRDFYPEEKALHTWLLSKIRAVSQSFGYQEYEGPYLERIDLYAAKSGEELVKEQAFVFPDRGGDLITLRPELTPTLARMVAQKQNELAFPLRWWSFGPFWRYERPQKGRTREFFQWNIDLIGANSPESDAEMLSICATFFKQVGLGPEKVRILVNNRHLMEDQLSGLGIDAAERKKVFHIIDRRDKLSPESWESYALESGLTANQLNGVKTLLADEELWQKSPELVRVFNVLQAVGLAEYVRYSAGIIRGLDYYTGLVFEAVDQDGGRAILGGGHYDNLVSDVGGEQVPAVGFAMGDVMISLVLQKYGCTPALNVCPAQVLVTVFDESRLAGSYELAAKLRAEGINAAVYPDAVKLPKQFKYADRVGIRLAVVVGPDEEAAGQATLKDLAGHAQETLPINALAPKIRELIG